MIDFMLFGGFDDGQTDRQTNERTLVVVESLSRLKTRQGLRKPQKEEFVYSWMRSSLKML